MRNKLVISIIILAFVGFIDATYLTIKHYTGGLVACTASGCEQVLTSQYATIQSIPLSGFGAAYYIFLLILAIIYLDTKNQRLIKIILLISGLGLGFSIYLVYLQVFVIQAICLYCAGSAIITLTIAILSLIKNKHLRSMGAETK